jgi:hypothetical protein
MTIYFAGGVTGNNVGRYKEGMKIYIASAINENRAYIFDDKNKTAIENSVMKAFLTGNDGYRKWRFTLRDLNILESYFYIRTQEWMYPLIETFKSFMLDSGAFTYIQSGQSADWQKYVRDYAAFVKAHDIDLFFELDVDSVVGLKEVESLRRLLERLTGKRCIPVWHRTRGWEYWKKMCREYKYVAIGGIVSKEIRPEEYPIFTKLIDYAYDRDVKVHGLGFTNMKCIGTYRFDSIDSSTWLAGCKAGFVFRFNGSRLERIKSTKRARLKSREAAMHNFSEWVKFAKYAEENL